MRLWEEHQWQQGAEQARQLSFGGGSAAYPIPFSRTAKSTLCIPKAYTKNLFQHAAEAVPCSTERFRLANARVNVQIKSVFSKFCKCHVKYSKYRFWVQNAQIGNAIFQMKYILNKMQTRDSADIARRICFSSMAAHSNGTTQDRKTTQNIPKLKGTKLIKLKWNQLPTC
jgi:hypothetical protein